MNISYIRRSQVEHEAKLRPWRQDGESSVREFTTNSKSIRKRVPLAVKVIKGPTRSNHRGGRKQYLWWMDGTQVSSIPSFPDSVYDCDSPKVRTGSMYKDRFYFFVSKCGGWMVKNHRFPSEYEIHLTKKRFAHLTGAQEGNRERKRTEVQTLRGSSSE